MRGLIERRVRERPGRAALEERVVISRAAWLSEDVVLFVCDTTTSPEPSFAAFEGCPAPRRIEGRLLALVSPTVTDSASPVTVGVAYGFEPVPDNAVLTVEDGEHTIAVSARQLLGSINDLGTLLREHLAGLKVGSRESVLAFLSALPLSFGDTPALTASLRVARDSLRERHPLSVDEHHADLAVGIDAVCRIDRRRFYVEGWVVDSSVPMLRLTALSPEGEVIDLSEAIVRYPRPDVAPRSANSAVDPARAGFACMFQTRAPSGSEGWVFTLSDVRERRVETAEIALVEDGDEVRRTIAAAAEQDFDERVTLLAQHVEPALTRLQADLRDRIGIASLAEFGAGPDDPTLSIVVALDRGGELLEHHLAQVADDATLRACELICVQDGSQDAEHCGWRARQLFDLYGVPFSLAVLTERGGVALGRAAGASIASAPRLLFLDAGVLGVAPGWLSTLAGFQSATPSIGAVTGKLVGPDGAIRHAGFTFERLRERPWWNATERFAGLHESVPAANITCPVPALSGACMLVDKARYALAAAEGWRFLNGGNADRDACLRMHEAGYENWYLPRVALLSLNLDASATAARQATDAYNGWLLDHLWRERFETVSELRAFGAGHPA
jgi:GT2 family glycosyltransferase